MKTTSVWQLVREHILSTIARYKPKIPVPIPSGLGFGSLNWIF